MAYDYGEAESTHSRREDGLGIKHDEKWLESSTAIQPRASLLLSLNLPLSRTTTCNTATCLLNISLSVLNIPLFNSLLMISFQAPLVLAVSALGAPVELEARQSCSALQLVHVAGTTEIGLGIVGTPLALALAASGYVYSFFATSGHRNNLDIIVLLPSRSRTTP
jgi:hypothetical protein